ncbi:hypothetical protein SAMN03159341_102357 [Paenibacillus sp. 1_12]|nr:hypothetical protein SAMN03159341_102357 [Paenibacillus sp. 1_12]
MIKRSVLSILSTIGYDLRGRLNIPKELSINGVHILGKNWT